MAAADSRPVRNATARRSTATWWTWHCDGMQMCKVALCRQQGAARCRRCRFWPQVCLKLLHESSYESSGYRGDSHKCV